MVINCTGCGTLIIYCLCVCVFWSKHSREATGGLLWPACAQSFLALFAGLVAQFEGPTDRVNLSHTAQKVRSAFQKRARY